MRSLSKIFIGTVIGIVINRPELVAALALS